MGWVDSPNFFCAFLGALTDMAKALVDTDLPVLFHSTISVISANRPGPTCNLDNLTHIYCYMDDVISAV